MHEYITTSSSVHTLKHAKHAKCVIMFYFWSLSYLFIAHISVSALFSMHLIGQIS